MDILEQRKKLDEYNLKLVTSLVSALGLEQFQDHYSCMGRIQFEVTREKVVKRFLRKDKIKTVTEVYLLCFNRNYPYITFQNLWDWSDGKVCGEDYKTNPSIRTKWAIFAIQKYVSKIQETLDGRIQDKDVLEKLLAMYKE